MFAILSSLISIYTICHSQQFDQGLHRLPFSAVWSGSTLFAILSLIRVYTICHSQSDQGLHCSPFSAVWSGSTVIAFFSSLIKVKLYTVILRNSPIRVYTICHSQQFDQGLYYFSILSKQYYMYQVLQCLPFSAVWSGSTLFAILSKQYYQGLHCFIFSAVWSVSTLLPFSVVWSRFTLFAILSSLIEVYTICYSQESDQGLHCHSQQSDQGLHYLPFAAVWSRSRSTIIVRNSLIRVYTICHSQQFDQGLYYFSILSKQYYQVLQCLPFSAVWSGFTLFVILSRLIRVYTICHSL